MAFNFSRRSYPIHVKSIGHTIAEDDRTHQLTVELIGHEDLTGDDVELALRRLRTALDNVNFALTVDIMLRLRDQDQDQGRAAQAD